MLQTKYLRLFCCEISIFILLLGKAKISKGIVAKRVNISNGIVANKTKYPSLFRCEEKLKKKKSVPLYCCEEEKISGIASLRRKINIYNEFVASRSTITMLRRKVFIPNETSE